MPDLVTQIAVGGLTAVAAAALASAVRGSVRRGEWSWGTLLGACVVTFTLSVVQVLATYLDAWTELTDVHRNVSTVAPVWAQMCLRVTSPLLAIGAIAVFWRGLHRRNTPVNIPAVLMVLLILVSGASALLHGDMPVRSFSLLLLAIVLACVVAPRGLGVQLGIATATMVAALAGGMALIVCRHFSVVECVAGHKCGVLGFNFRGILDNENAFALVLALALPFIWIAFGGWQGITMSAYVTGLVLLTGSRSGTVAAVVTFSVLVAVRPDIRRPVATPVRSAAVATMLSTVAGVGIAVPFIVDDPESISGRAALWQLARAALADPATALYGTGTLGWDHVRDAGLIDSSAVYSVHNQWLNVMFSTGLIGILLFVTALAVLLWQSRNGHFLVVAGVLTPFVVLGVTERPWPIDTADWLTWALAGALLCCPARASRASTEIGVTPAGAGDLPLASRVLPSITLTHNSTRADA